MRGGRGGCFSRRGRAGGWVGVGHSELFCFWDVWVKEACLFCKGEDVEACVNLPGEGCVKETYDIRFYSAKVRMWNQALICRQIGMQQKRTRYDIPFFRKGSFS